MAKHKQSSCYREALIQPYWPTRSIKRNTKYSPEYLSIMGKMPR